MHEYTSLRRVEFADTDLGGICHFSRFFVFMETAEHQFLETLGTRVHLEHEGRTIGWPRVAASCDYHSPARFGDVLEIQLRVLRKGTRSLSYGFVFETAGRRVASGRVTAVCCVLEPGREVRSIPIPAFLAERIEVAPE
jgi:4-hydroxybenzoyl-CoA thioesterase/acyl-CoA thioester hydrolase